MTQKNVKRWNEIYTKFGETLPWCIEDVPIFFRKLISSGWVYPSKTLDIGCGIGKYANYLSEQGFDVTAIDLSNEAIRKANNKFKRDNLKFKVGDAFNLKFNNETFDFIYEVSLLHNISPNKREGYIDEIYRVLKKGGKILVCCFSDKDKHFNGKKELYFPELDNTVYPLSVEELDSLFAQKFKIQKIEKVFFGKSGLRQKERLICLMEKPLGAKK